MSVYLQAPKAAQCLQPGTEFNFALLFLQVLVIQSWGKPSIAPVRLPAFAILRDCMRFRRDNAAYNAAYNVMRHYESICDDPDATESELAIALGQARDAVLDFVANLGPVGVPGIALHSRWADARSLFSDRRSVLTDRELQLARLASLSLGVVLSASVLRVRDSLLASGAPFASGVVLDRAIQFDFELAQHWVCDDRNYSHFESYQAFATHVRANF